MQHVKISVTEGDPAAVRNSINNLDDNDGSSPDSSPESPRDQMLDANPPYSQVLIGYLRAYNCFCPSRLWELEVFRTP